MGSSSDPCADSTAVGIFLLPDDNLLAGADTDPHVAAESPEAFYELSQYQTGEAFLLGILNANRKIRKRTDTGVAFTREYSRVSIFHRERECTN